MVVARKPSAPTKNLAPPFPRMNPVPPRGGKLATIIERIEQMAVALPPGARLPSVRDLKAHLGVSFNTLDAALTRLEARRVICRQHGVGVFVAPGAQRANLCLICPPHFFVGAGRSEPFWDELVRRAMEQAWHRGETLTLHLSRPANHTDRPGSLSSAFLHDDLVKQIRAGEIQGALTVGLEHAAVRWIEDKGVPVVAFAGPARYMVVFDYQEMVQLGVAALARRGCRRLGLWSPTHSQDESNDGLPSYAPNFTQMVASFRLPVYPELIRDREPWVRNALHAVPCPRQGYDLAMAVFGPHSDPTLRPDGIVCTNDMMAQGALMALSKLGIQPGNHVWFATHANSGTTTLLFWEDDLIRLECPLAELVDSLYTTLAALTQGRPLPGEWRPSPHSGNPQTPEWEQVIRPRLAYGMHLTP